MFKRLFSRKDNVISAVSETGSQVDSVRGTVVEPPSVGFNEVGIQIEIPVKTVSTTTSYIQSKDKGTATDMFDRIEKDTCTESVSKFDATSQTSVAHMDAAVDPGEWNYTIFRGVDSQTDAPEAADPLIWLSGTLEDSVSLVRRLVGALERDELGSRGPPADVDALKLRADNVLLRIEVSSLKRKIGKLESMTTSRSLPVRVSDSRKSQKDAIFALTGGCQYSTTFVVTSQTGVTVTSNLAPSSAPLGVLKPGDKILLAGSPEEICGEIRGPVLPRGWVTLRDSSNTYLRKSG